MQGMVEGKALKPRGICCDNNGHFFLSDAFNRRLLILEVMTGKVLQVSLEKEYGVLFDVCWSNTQPHLVVKHGNGSKYKVSLFKVE